MSSMKNAMKTQKVHRERHQNEARAHLGPLEKKKDYKIRAKDQETKKKMLKRLYKKALDKNPDEFHFHMCNSQLENGMHHENAQQKEISSKDVKADLTYVRFRRTMEKNKIDKLRSNLHFLEPCADDEPENTHLLFVDTEEQARNTTAAEIFNTHPDLMNRRFNRLTLDQLQNLPDTMDQLVDIKKASSEKSKSYKELVRRVARDEKLRLLEQKLEAKLLLMQHEEKNKSRHVKLPGPTVVKEGTATSAPVYKWPSIRKRQPSHSPYPYTRYPQQWSRSKDHWSPE